MATTLDDVAKVAMELSPSEKLALAQMLLEDSKVSEDFSADTAWDSEIRDRMRAVEEGRVVGVSYEEVMRAAEARLGQ